MRPAARAALECHHGPVTESKSPRSWREMYEQIAAQIKRETGTDVAGWNARIREWGPNDAPSLKAWLNEQGVDGYPAMLLGYETFGYPDYLQASAEDLIAGQYRDKPALRSIYDRLMAELPKVGEVEVQARKTYVALIGPRRTFASIQPTTKTRVDIGLRFDDAMDAKGLPPAKSIGQSSMTHKLGLSSPNDVTHETIGWLRRAYEANL
jgi:predicted transport protein